MGPAQTSSAIMATALNAALAGPRGANPLVGAVLVDHTEYDGAGSPQRVLATGYHQGAGTFHAERDCLTKAQAAGITDFSGTTLYTTLEPCTHYGRQPACTDLISQAGIPRVVVGATDPSPNGGGAELLRGRGAEVALGVLGEECTQLNHRWNRAAAQRRPFVTVHLAQSIDARIAAADGTSQWITSAVSRQHTHSIRQRVHAVLVGTNTAEIDDPRLTARDSNGSPTEHQPLRTVMGLREIHQTAQLKQGQAEGQGWLQLRTRDPLTALQTLAGTSHHGHPVKHVLVEGGQSVLSAFFTADLVDEIFLYTAPLILGAGRASLGDIGVTTLAEARQFALDTADGGPTTIMDNDVCIHLQPDPKGAR
ncbi:bifunctional diaminohydroxyphosphoribosylaminopyrimidine deaminase/5-amino-6-(5-phosphoribosylamino)uracil reductase RibD [Nesterenkonia ebinurensis]|uniref:bifunctional diaminohydroxyphosphoribosylaminopyrimidine deaminase/5-amino-6-(5-phosphoribosylamino)uracil reductase RibD n=1 Tax=Nesterenkonia ebinurensis TaxID=2608252 RepID=UPI001CC3B2C6|nr:bifunctional diaminohydroxyphosphoribosylaminopyrimidine deaminase/5-amino-6-(5-phosphoribosylamino)uracil reductase RibD [Nesterenkonia ebinurensis]